MPDTSLRNALALPLSSDGGNEFYTGLHSSLETIDAAIAKCTDAKALDPSTDDDDEEGYATRSVCVTVGHKIFLCEDPSTGAAIWRQLWPPLAADMDLSAYQLVSGMSAYLANSLIDAKGDLIAGSADNTPARVAVGTNGQSLIADSTQTAGLVWDSSRLTGWIAAPALTYAASDAPSYTVTITGDYSAIITPGMRIKLTDSTVKYFIVTKSEYSAPNTTLTLYGGTDYTLSGGAISSPHYSIAKAPAGFPPNPAKWTVEITSTSDDSQSNPASGTWYNLGGNIVIPIGVWRVLYLATVYVTRPTAGIVSGIVTLSTANNSESDVDLSVYGWENNSTGWIHSRNREKFLMLTTKTTYYLNAKVADAGLDLLRIAGSTNKIAIRATCAYL
jgi:hypothetical protein